MKLKKRTTTVVVQMNPVGQVGAFTLHANREAAEKYIKKFVQDNIGGGIPIGLTDPMWLILPASIVFVGEHRKPEEDTPKLVQPVGAGALAQLKKTVGTP